MGNIKIDDLSYLPRNEKPKLAGNSKDVYSITLPKEFNEFYKSDAKIFYSNKDNVLVIAYAFELEE